VGRPLAEVVLACAWVCTLVADLQLTDVILPTPVDNRLRFTFNHVDKEDVDKEFSFSIFLSERDEYACRSSEGRLVLTHTPHPTLALALVLTCTGLEFYLLTVPGFPLLWCVRVCVC
jgi:Chromosome segregation protein Spc25